MTTFTTNIVLGKKYKDERLGIEGHANVVAFQPHGCVEALLEYMKDGKPERYYVNVLRLQNDSAESLVDTEYKTDLVQGHEYEDTETGIKGWLSIVEFHEHMSTRGILRSLKNGKNEVKYHSIDEFLLRDLTEKDPEPAADRSGKKSPARSSVEHYTR